MRILILHSRYLSGSTSGENRVVEDETRLLREAGHEVTTWLPSPTEVGVSARLSAGANAIWSTRAAATVRRLVGRHQPDVVHCHNLFPMLSPAVIRVAAAEAPVLATLHNYRLLCLPATFVRDGESCEACLGHLPWRGVRYRCYRDSALGSGALATSLGIHRALGTFDQVRRFLAVSDFVRAKHIEAGFPPGRIAVKPNFSWAIPRREGPGEYFLYLGRLSPEKGVPTLIEAWRGRSARLIVAGGGPQMASLRRDAPAAVNLLGDVPPEDVAGLLVGARALLVPSRAYEGSPRAVLEAYAAGVPVLASRLGSLTEVVDDGVSGLLLDPHAPGEWRAAVDRLLDDDEAERLGEGAWRTWKARYGPETGLRALEAAYREAIEAA